MLRSLETRDKAVAAQCLPTTLAAIRADVSARLKAAGMRSLDTGWDPNWLRIGAVTDDAMRAREEILSVSDRVDQHENGHDPGGRPINISTSLRYRKQSDIIDIAASRAEELTEQGKDGGPALRPFSEIATGQATPLRLDTLCRAGDICLRRLHKLRLLTAHPVELVHEIGLWAFGQFGRRVVGICPGLAMIGHSLQVPLASCAREVSDVG